MKERMSKVLSPKMESPSPERQDSSSPRSAVDQQVVVENPTKREAKTTKSVTFSSKSGLKPSEVNQIRIGKLKEKIKAAEPESKEPEIQEKKVELETQTRTRTQTK